jgi:hypothetical protein
MKRRLLKGITDLRKPAIVNGVIVAQSEDPRDAMMTSNELVELNKKTRSLYIWNNYWTPITDPTGTKYTYKG